MIPIVVEGLHYSYGNGTREILKGIDLEINQGETVAIVGISGNGKSTLCYCLCGIIPHVYKGDFKGKVLLFDEDIQKMTMGDIAKRVGIVYQDPDTQLFSQLFLPNYY